MGWMPNASMPVDNITIDTNISGQLEIKGGSVGASILAPSLKPWILKETLTGTNTGSVTTTSLGSHAFYRIEYQFSGMANGVGCHFQVSSNSTNDQTTFELNVGAATSNGTDNRCHLWKATVSGRAYNGSMEFSGDTQAGGVSLCYQNGSDGNGTQCLSSRIPGISSMANQTISFFAYSGLITGTVRVYYHD